MSKLDKCVLDEKLTQLLEWYRTPSRLMSHDLIDQEGKLEKELKKAGISTNELWDELRPVREDNSWA